MELPHTLIQRALSIWKHLCPFRRLTLKHRATIPLSSTSMKLYIVDKGFVRLTSIQSDGTQITRIILGKGGVFGELPFAPNLFRVDEEALANGPTCVLEFDLMSTEEALRDDKVAQRLLVELLGAQLQMLSRRLQWQQTNPIEKRIALVLFDPLCFGGRPCPHGPGYALDIRMTHEELAEIVGAARPTVSAILSEFHQEQLISSTRTFICVRNLERLKHRLSLLTS